MPVRTRVENRGHNPDDADNQREYRRRCGLRLDDEPNPTEYGGNYKEHGMSIPAALDPQSDSIASLKLRMSIDEANLARWMDDGGA